MVMDKKKIHVAVVFNSEDNVNTSFYFKDATVEQLAMLNQELDILKQEILERVKYSPKDYEVQDFGDENGN